MSIILLHTTVSTLDWFRVINTTVTLKQWKSTCIVEIEINSRSHKRGGLFEPFWPVGPIVQPFKSIPKMKDSILPLNTPIPPTTPKQRSTDFLDGIRALAIFLVVAAHSGLNGPVINRYVGSMRRNSCRYILYPLSFSNDHPILPSIKTING